jgi:hypothetical protein
MSAATCREEDERITKAEVGQKIHAKQIDRKFVVEASCGGDGGVVLRYTWTFPNNLRRISYPHRPASVRVGTRLTARRFHELNESP